MVDLISIGYQDPEIVPEEFLWMICFSGTAVVVEDVQMDLSGTYHPVDHGVCLEVHTTVFVAAGLPVQRKMIIELPIDDGSDQRSGGNAVT